MSTTGVFVLAVFAVIICVIVKQVNSGMVPLISLVAAVLIFAVALGMLSEIFELIRSFWDSVDGFSEYLSPILQIIGVVILGEFSAGLARDNGQTVLAGAVLLFCRASVLVLCLPIFSDVLKMLGEILV